jgi:hypothetical protein
MILKRYDSIEVRGWGSANDMIPREFGERTGGAGVRPEGQADNL